MADPVMWMSVASTALNAGGSLYQGNQAKKAADSEARQIEYRAGQERAASQRQAEEQRRQARLAMSRAQAVAGGGGSDQTVVDLIGDMAAEGELRALTSIYEGDDRAFGLEQQAAARRREGKAARTAGYINAVSSVLRGGQSMFKKYGGGDSGMPDSVPTRGGR